MTIFGSDISHYDAPDTRPMFADGIVFQTHKAGGDSNDAELAQWWTYVRGYRDRVLLGAYWVLYPGSPTARADAFLARLDSQCPGWRDGPFILQADCEKWNGDPGTVPSVAEVNVFCDRLRAKMPKLMPIGYLPDWVYGDISGFKYPLWSSKYVTGSGSFKSLYPGDSAKQWAPYGGKPSSILQYTSSAVIGGQTTCDANAYRGTLAELTTLLAPGWTQERIIVNADDVKAVRAAVQAELGEFFAVGQQPAAKGGLPESKIGHDASSQGVPDTIDGGTTTLYQLVGKIGSHVLRVESTVGELAGKDLVDEGQIVAGILAGLTPEVLGRAITASGLTPAAIAAAIPADVADQVLDELAGRIQPK
jgi:hypothetical protein